MKIRISDMMDQVDGDLLGTEPIETASLERIKEKTMMKIHKKEARHGWRGLTRKGMVAAGIAAALCISAGAYAVLNWDGFARTDDLTEQEIVQLLEKAELGQLEVEEADGTVHYLDQDGNEVMVLTAAEAAAYEKERLEAREQAVIGSTQLVDVSGMEFIPNSITEVDVDANGAFPDFALGNGHAILLYPEGEQGWQLSAGDVVTLNLNTDEACYLTVGQFRDGTLLEEHTVNGAAIRDSITIGEDGVYAFSLIYASASANNFTDCSLTIN